jgi:hypothetical protein
MPPKRLVVTGFYRYVRNPMYVAFTALVAGQGLLFGTVCQWVRYHGRYTASVPGAMTRKVARDHRLATGVAIKPSSARIDHPRLFAEVSCEASKRRGTASRAPVRETK